MKPSKSLLDRSFNYVPSTSTNVEETWRRYGWRPISEKEREAKVRTLRAVEGNRIAEGK